VELFDPRGKSHRFRRPRPGDEIYLLLRSELSRELALPSAAARIHELQASGLDRVAVRVVKAPLADVLGPEDAVKVEAPELVEADDPTVYVRVKFLELPVI
jgi:hypothetical protein